MWIENVTRTQYLHQMCEWNFRLTTLYYFQLIKVGFVWISSDLASWNPADLEMLSRQFKWKENTRAEVRRLSNRGNVMIPLMKTESRLPSLMALLLISVCISTLCVFQSLLVMNEPNGFQTFLPFSHRRRLRPAFITSPCTITPSDGRKETTLSLAGLLHWGVECPVGFQQQWQRKPAFIQLLLSSTSSLSVMG